MRKVVIRAAAVSLAVLLAGCANTVGSSASEVRSGFSGGRVVSIGGHGNACKSTTCTGLGGQWDSSKPEAAILSVYVFNDIKGITGASFAIDGAVTRVTPLPGLTHFSRPGDMLKQSRHDFSVPLSLIRHIVEAKKVWLRVQTTDGYMEDAVIEGTDDSKAYHAMKRFLAQIDGQPKS